MSNTLFLQLALLSLAIVLLNSLVFLGFALFGKDRKQIFGLAMLILSLLPLGAIGWQLYQGLELKAMVRPRTPSFKDGREVLEHFCLNCHRWQGQWGEIAPDLSQLLRDYTPQRLKQLLKRPANQLMVSVPLGEEETQRLMEYFLEQGLLQGKDRTAEMENQQIPAIFRDKQCLLCHRLDGTGGEIGPDLREAYQRNGAAGLKAKLSGSGQSQGMMPVIPLTEKEMAVMIKYLEAKQ
ncbi:Cytochrome c [Carboxydocella thermautotrophica]|nr:Cytochrome c [Carboxydocella thermautotrophica]